MNALLISAVLGVAVAVAAPLGARAAEPAASPAERPWVTPAIEAPGVSFRTFESAAARTRVSYHVFVPAAYDREPARRFPVVYWLHGSGGGLRGIPPIAARFAAAIDAGTVPPCLIVFVNGMPNGMYVDWKDGSTPLETVIVEDLVPHVDASYRTIARREGRLLDGYSMGGYGAARLRIPHTWTVLPGVDHDPLATLEALGDAHWALYRQAFGGDAVADEPALRPGERR